MKNKSFFLILVPLVLISCDILISPLYNVNNDFKWKNKKFDNPVKINFIFNPYVVKELDSENSDLSEYLNEPNKLNIINSIFREKLENRNFIISIKPQEFVFTVDTISFKETAEMIDVSCTDKDGDYEDLGHHPEFNYSIKISANLKSKDSLTTQKVIKSEYSFINSPGESILSNCNVIYDVAWVNFDKVLNNEINRMSYDCYFELKNKKMSLK